MQGVTVRGDHAFATGGLPQLVRTLHAQANPKRSDDDVPRSGAWLMALLHGATILLLVIAALGATERSGFRDVDFLPAGSVPSAYVTLVVANVMLFSAFTVTSIVDAAWFLATQPLLTGVGLGFGFASCTISGGMVVLSSLHLTERLFWLYLTGLLCGTVVLALQLATIFSLLIKGDGALLRAIRLSV